MIGNTHSRYSGYMGLSASLQLEPGIMQPTPVIESSFPAFPQRFSALARYVTPAQSAPGVYGAPSRQDKMTHWKHDVHSVSRATTTKKWRLLRPSVAGGAHWLSPPSAEAKKNDRAHARREHDSHGAVHVHKKTYDELFRSDNKRMHGFRQHFFAVKVGCVVFCVGPRTALGVGWSDASATRWGKNSDPGTVSLQYVEKLAECTSRKQKHNL